MKKVCRMNALAAMWFFLVWLTFPFEVYASGAPKNEVLRALESIKEIKKIEQDPDNAYIFTLYFEQHIDPFDAKSPTFLQRIFLNHREADAPVVVELEGYACESAALSELATICGANQIGIEHRYFGKSFPKGAVPYATLTIRNAAEDHHRIIEAFRKALYPDNFWISTGISKGGQTTLIHRSFYPEDVNASVCYVAPLNFERYDARVHDFLESVGTAEERAKIRAFQRMCLERKAELVRELEMKMKEKRWSWAFPTEVALEYYVLEYSFAFWQWGGADVHALPNASSAPREVLNHVLNVAGVSFFEKSGVQQLQSYFYTAMTEEGIYDYDTAGFSDLLSREVYNFEFSLPPGFEKAPFDPTKMQDLHSFLQNDARNMLFIYGELDPWSATAVHLPEDAAAKGLYKFVNEGGNHATRILSFEEEARQSMLKILQHWLSAE